MKNTQKIFVFQQRKSMPMISSNHQLIVKKSFVRVCCLLHRKKKREPKRAYFRIKAVIKLSVQINLIYIVSCYHWEKNCFIRTPVSTENGCRALVMDSTVNWKKCVIFHVVNWL